MTNRNVLLGIGIFMLIVTTLLLVLIPFAVHGPLDKTQKFIMGALGTVGYLGAWMYFQAYTESKNS